MTTYADATTIQTTDEIRDDLLGGFASSTLAGWPSDAPQRILIEGEATALRAEQEARQSLAYTASPSTVANAGSDWVDAILEWFDLDNGSGGKGRIPALPTTWDLPMQVNPSNAPLTLNGTSGVVIQANEGPFYVIANQADVTLNSGNNYQAYVRFEARIPGTSGNVAITGGKIVQGPAGLILGGFGAPSLVSAGRDAETDEAFIARALGKWGTLGAGWNRASFDYLIPTLAPTVTRWYVDDLLPDGAVTVYLANATGPATVQEIADVNTGLGADDVKALGSGVLTVQAASAVVLAITASVTVDGSSATAAADVEANLEALGAAFPIGPATLELDLVRSVLMGAAYTTVAIATTGGAFKTITVNLPAVPGIVGIASLSISSDQTIALGEVLQLSATVTGV